MPRRPDPIHRSLGPHEYGRLSRAEKHAADQHRKSAGARQKLAAEAGEGSPEHAEHLAVADAHEAAARAHEALSRAYEAGDSMDPRVRHAAEHAAGRRVMLTHNDKGEPVRDDVTERERHSWLLRHRAKHEVARYDDGRTETLRSVVGCECSVCAAERVRGAAMVEGARKLALHVAARKTAQAPAMRPPVRTS